MRVCFPPDRAVPKVSRYRSQSQTSACGQQKRWKGCWLFQKWKRLPSHCGVRQNGYFSGRGISSDSFVLAIFLETRMRHSGPMLEMLPYGTTSAILPVPNSQLFKKAATTRADFKPKNGSQPTVIPKTLGPKKERTKCRKPDVNSTQDGQPNTCTGLAMHSARFSKPFATQLPWATFPQTSIELLNPTKTGSF